jgi:hypothetical protein
MALTKRYFPMRHLIHVQEGFQSVHGKSLVSMHVRYISFLDHVEYIFQNDSSHVSNNRHNDTSAIL